MPSSEPTPYAEPRILLAGYLPRSQFVAELGKGWRTVLRLEHAGLPFVKLGGTKLYPIDQCRAWILSHAQAKAPRGRGRGRPRKAA